MESKSAGEELPPPLPTDTEISRYLRSYCDYKRPNHRTHPLGIAKVLRHLLVDLRLPISSFGPSTYTTLITSSKSPTEARRIMKMMREDSKLPLNAHVYAILIHKYSKAADFRSALKVFEEMKYDTSDTLPIKPTLPAYTSFLAGCYRIINNTSIHPSIKAEAANVAWDKWVELRSHPDFDADVMAYGAMMRILAALGRPEQAINLLEEMIQFDIKPTTLLFTSALKAVHRSHNNDIRFRTAYLKKGRKREQITSHHGKMAREIVIMAEQAEIDQDDGFVSALMLCAGSAGDVATAKAIYLASRIRRMGHRLRTIGDDHHLRALRQDLSNPQIMDQYINSIHGAATDDHHMELLPNNSSNNNNNLSQLSQSTIPSNTMLTHNNINDDDVHNSKAYHAYLQREYGTNYNTYNNKNKFHKDTRILSALLYACGKSIQTYSHRNGSLGTMWKGRDNYGYLDINSLRMIITPAKPKYKDTQTIPGLSGLDVGLASMKFSEEGDSDDDDDDDDEKKSRRLRKAKKFRLIDQDMHGNTLDELDEDLYQMFQFDKKDDDEKKKQQPSKIAWTEEERNELLSMKQELQKDDFFDVDNNDNDDDNDKNDDHDETSSSSSLVSKEDDNNMKLISEPKKSKTMVEKLYFDTDERKWKKRFEEVLEEPKQETIIPEVQQNKKEKKKKKNKQKNAFSKFNRPTMMIEDDDNDISTKNNDSNKNNVDIQNPNQSDEKSMIDYNNKELKSLYNDVPELQNNDFDTFYENLLQEMKEGKDIFPTTTDNNDEDNDDDFDTLDKDEAKAMFELLQQGQQSFPQNDDDSNNDDDDDDLDADQLQAFLDDTSKQEKFFRQLSLSDDVDDIEDEEDEEQQQKALAKLFRDMKNSEEEEEEESSNQETAESTTDPKMVDRELDEMMDKLFPGPSDDDDDDDNNDDEVYDDEDDDDDHIVNDEEKIFMPSKNSSESDVFIPSIVGDETSPLDDDDDMTQDESSSIQHHSMMDSSKDDSALLDDDDDDVEEARYQDIMMQELRTLLPGMPEKRLRRVRKTFEGSLGDPSMLRLVLALRENMPWEISLGWLKQKNLQNAKFVMDEAEREGMVDIHMLNGMLQVQASSGKLDSVLSYYENAYRDNKLTPTKNTDRIVFDALIRNKRISRALTFKDQLEARGRNIDLLSYGAFVEYFGNRNEIGSALMMVRECIRIHGVPPPEKTLKRLRRRMRVTSLDRAVDLDSVVGEDPLAWLVKGRMYYKSRRPKTGQGETSLPRNLLLQS